LAAHYLEVLAAFSAGGVEFVLIGGVAAVTHGAPYDTFDVDVVYRRSDENIARLMTVLTSLRAEFHDLTNRHLPPTASLLALPGPKLLRTSLGRLDVLGELDEHTTWDELVSDAARFDLGFPEGPVLVISLARLIAVKERVRRPRDLAVLPLLYAVRDRLRQKD
jgi:hypothetical protein